MADPATFLALNIVFLWKQLVYPDMETICNSDLIDIVNIKI